MRVFHSTVGINMSNVGIYILYIVGANNSLESFHSFGEEITPI